MYQEAGICSRVPQGTLAKVPFLDAPWRGPVGRRLGPASLFRFAKQAVTRGESEDGTPDRLTRKFDDLIARKGFDMRRFILVFTVAMLAALWFNNASADDWTPLWSTATLSQARMIFRRPRREAWSSLLEGTPAAATATKQRGRYLQHVHGNLVHHDPVAGTWRIFRRPRRATRSFLRGGDSGDYVGSNVVDIYNTSTGIWSTGDPIASVALVLRQPRRAIRRSSPEGTPAVRQSISNVVDIYNTSTGTWSTAALSQARL